MDSKEKKKTSKFLSLVLRHRPETIGIELDSAGWVDVHVLLAALARRGHTLSRADLETVVATNDKQRFAFNENRTQIRANQGHSIDVKLGYEKAEPPEYLLHGTSSQFVASILKNGLQKMKRHHVHLHVDASIAKAVGDRRGTAVMLEIRAGEMDREGFEFFVTPNHVWLTDEVPAQFIRVFEDA